MQDTYLTISKTSEGFYKEKGSKFMAFAYPVSSEEEIKEKQDALRKQFYDARHHCYAYIYGNESDFFRANDDGEPNHSAGDPILGQIKSRNLTNTLVIVIRYFGGTKLGVSGLINAYRTAASEALDQNKIVEKQITQAFRLSFPYEEMNEVMKLVKDFDLNIKDQGFETESTLDFEVIISKIDMLEAKIQLLIDLKHSLRLKALI